MLKVVEIEPRHVTAGGHRAAEPVVADVEEVQVGHARDLRGDAAIDGIVAHIDEVEALREHQA